MREAASQSTAIANGNSGIPATATAAASDAGAAVEAGDWLFSELSDQLERAEDGLLAGACVRCPLKICSSLLCYLYFCTQSGAVDVLFLEGR